MKIDHVSIAWSDLASLRSAFEEAGLKTDYGGLHSNGKTHMSLLAFDDGSYIELISVVKPGPSPSWPQFIADNGGPCAWAIEVHDIAREAERIRSLGIKTIGPGDYNRKRPDGVLVEWKLVFIGDKEPGATLPFLIEDITPRDYRVKPSPSVSSGGGKRILTGVEKVVLGVKELEKEVDLFRKVYSWEEPSVSDNLGGEFEGITLAQFKDTPVVLASPVRKDTWLGKRLDKFGDSPCTFLIGASDMKAAIYRYHLKNQQKWIGDSNQTVAWLPLLDGVKLGFIGS